MITRKRLPVGHRTLLSLVLLAAIAPVVAPRNAAASVYPNRLLATGSGDVLVVEDLNCDDRPDLVVENDAASLPGAILVNLNLGDGAFSSGVSYAAGLQPKSVAVADLNNDGAPDLALLNTSPFPPGSATGLSIYLGSHDCDGTFSLQAQYPTGNTPGNVVAGDVNRDGNVDLVAVASGFGGLGDGFFVYVGDGHGAFAPPARIPPVGTTSSVVLVDVNNDGEMDLLSPKGFSGLPPIEVRLGNGDATFAAPLRSGDNTLANPARLIPAFLDGDDRVDLVAINFSSSFTVYRGFGDGTFTELARYGQGVVGGGASVRDMNGDGITDIAVGLVATAPNDSGGVRIYAGRGDGSFVEGDGFAVGDRPSNIVLSDIDDDSIPDLVVRYGNGAGVVMGRGRTHFAAERRIRISRPTEVSKSIEALGQADFTGNGIPDLVVSTFIGAGITDIVTLSGDGRGGFSEIGRTHSSVGLADLELADLDGNGVQDLAFVAGFDQVGVLLATGGGNFAPLQLYRVGSNPTDLTIADIDNDGDADLATANHTSDDISFLRNDGTGHFSAEVRIPGNYLNEELDAGDFNSDGKTDLVTVGRNQMALILAGSAGGFTPPLVSTIDMDSSLALAAVRSIDWDEDGCEDLIIAAGKSFNRDGFIGILPGQCTGALGPMQATATGSSFEPSRLEVADVDGDGHRDILGNWRDLFVFVAYGSGGLQLGNVERFKAGVGYGFATGDLDGDGRIDVVHADSTDGVAVLLNQLSPHVGPPVAYAGNDQTVECAGPLTPVSLDGSGSSDPDSTPGTNDDIVDFVWSEGQTILATVEGAVVNLPPGVHELGLSVVDGTGMQDSDGVRIAVVDTTPPEITCPEDVVVECDVEGGAMVRLAPALAVDGCMPPVVENDRTPGGSDASGLYSLGTTTVFYTARDAAGYATSCFTNVTVIDTTPPLLNVSLQRAILWPPNHRLVETVVSVVARDACGPATAYLLSVTSSEPDDAPGGSDGSTHGDIQGADVGTFDVAFDVRAERDSAGGGRIYTVTYFALDVIGYESYGSASILVPHDLGQGGDPVVVSMSHQESGTSVTWDAVPGALRYSLVRGDVQNLQETETAVETGPVQCTAPIAASPSGGASPDVDTPPLGHAFFYLVAYEDEWGSSGYGTVHVGKPRVVSLQDCP